MLVAAAEVVVVDSVVVEVAAVVVVLHRHVSVGWHGSIRFDSNRLNFPGEPFLTPPWYFQQPVGQSPRVAARTFSVVSITPMLASALLHSSLVFMKVRPATSVQWPDDTQS